MRDFSVRGVVCLVISMALAAGCSDVDLTDVAKVEIQLSTDSISFSTARLGEVATRQFVVTNVSQAGGVLEVAGVQIAQARDDFSISCSRGLSFELRDEEQSVCEVTFRPSDLDGQSASLTFISNASNPNGGRLALTTLGLRQNVEAVPAQVSFSTGEGQTDRRLVKIRNVGSSPLKVSGYEVTGQADLFEAEHDTDFYGQLSEGAPLVLNPHDERIGPNDERYKNNELQIFVTYRPEVIGSDAADLKIFSDDPDESVLEVPLTANSNAPCLLLVGGSRMDFSGVGIGSSRELTLAMQNCGNADLEIVRIEPGEGVGTLSDRGSTEPLIIDTGREDRPLSPDGTLEAGPIVIEPGEVETLSVVCAPSAEGPISGDFTLHTNDPLSLTAQVDIFCRGINNECPEPVALGTLRESPAPPSAQIEAAPLQHLILDGNDSVDTDGTVVEWVWELVEQPQGSVTRLEPVSGVPADPSRRELFLDLAGRYLIEMTAIDDDGCASAEPARLVVVVVPTAALHIQTVWNNPSDPDQTDLAGADVDLHFMKMPVGRWFEAPYDNYYANGQPVWSPESPTLDIDDTDGAGPENINLDNPLACQWYAVGVHYYRQQFGTAYTTVRIYQNGGLVFEYTNKPLQATNEFWDVARIHWPTGEIILVDEMLSAAPRGQEATITQAMLDADLCGTPIRP